MLCATEYQILFALPQGYIVRHWLTSPHSSATRDYTIYTHTGIKIDTVLLKYY